MALHSVLLHDTIMPALADKTKTAVRYEDKGYSYADIETMSHKLAASLQAHGVCKGDRVFVCLGNRVETIVSIIATLKAGGVFVNVGVEAPADKLSYMIKDCEATVLITMANKTKEINFSKDAYPSIKSVICVDGEAELQNAFSYDAAIAVDEDLFKEVSLIDLDLAAIIYTSGSTGNPKGVMLTHKNMVSALNSLEGYLGYRSSDIVLCSLPLSFDYGLYQMLMSMKVGATLLLEKEFTWPIFLIKKIVQYKVTIIPFVPTMLMLLNEYASRRGMQFGDVRAVTNTGAALKKSHTVMMKNLFPNAEIFSMYGLTECKRCTYLPPEDIETKPESIGIPIPNTEIWLEDDDGNIINEPNKVGQLIIRGSTVMAGYWRNSEATAKRLKPGRFPGERVLHTGDYCYRDNEGYLYFQGRMDHVIKSRGMKISPKEVEDYLHSIPEVEAAVAVGVDDIERGQALFTFIQVSQGHSISQSQILDLCRENLESHKVPKYVSILKTLPRTENGKFDVIALQSMAQQDLKAVA